MQRFARLFMHLRKKDVQIFLICLLGAILLWLLNALNRERTELISYPIEIIYNKKKYVALTPPPKLVYLNVRGSGWQILWKILRVNSDPLKLVLPSSYSQKQPYLVTSNMIREISEQLPNVEVEHVLTDSIHLDLDRVVKRRFFLKVNPFKINMKEKHHIVSNINIQPRQILISGPEQYLDKIANPFPLKFPTETIDSNFDDDVPLNFPVKNPELIQSERKSVRVQFKVSQFTHRTNTLIVSLKNFPKDTTWTLKDNHRLLKVTYAFQKQDIGRVRLSDFQILADFNTFDPADSTVALVLAKKPDFIRKEDIKFQSRVKLDHYE